MASKSNDQAFRTFSLIAIGLTAFLVPLIGGQFYVTVSSLGPGTLPIVGALFGGPDVPAWSHLLIVLPLFAAAGITLWKNHAAPFPRQPLPGLVLLLFGLIFATSLQTSFPYATAVGMFTFAAAGLILPALIAVAGRSKGPMTALYAFAAGTGVTSLIGIRSWELSRSFDPTWRIFSTWNNPNGLAGILVLGCFASLALYASEERLGKFAGALLFAIDAFGLFLTQSRGGLLSLTVGLIAALLVFLIKGRRLFPARQAAMLLIPFALAAILVTGAIKTTPKSSSGEVGGRLFASTSAGNQSKQFRILLWKTAVELIRQNPAGTGFDTFGYLSAKPGLVSQTLLTHNSLLQLAVEASPAAALALIGLVIAWLAACLKGKWIDAKRSTPLIFIIGAIFAIGVDGVFESDIYFFGTAAAIFLLMGIGLLLAPDGCSPELLPSGLRKMAACLMAGSMILLAWFGAEQYCLARVRFAQAASNGPEMSQWAQSAQTVFPANGEAYYLEAMAGQTNDPSSLLKSAASYSPVTRFIRAYANSLSAAGDRLGSDDQFRKALETAPNDLLTLRDAMRSEIKFGETDKAAETAHRMISIETKTIFQVRGLSEMVPMETVWARQYLASITQSPGEREKLLLGALPIEEQYATVTVDTLLQFHARYHASSYAGESLSEAAGKVALAQKDARDVMALCIKSGNTSGHEQAQRAAVVFDEAARRLAPFAGA